MRPATLISCAIKLKIIPVREDSAGGYSLHLVSLRYAAWNIVFVALFSVYAYTRISTIQRFDVNELVYLASGTSVVSLAPAIQLVLGVMLDRAEFAMVHCPEVGPLFPGLIFANVLAFFGVVMAQDFILMDLVGRGDYLTMVAVVGATAIALIMLGTQFFTVYTLTISLHNRINQLAGRYKAIELADILDALDIYTNVQSALQHSGCMIFFTIQFSLIGTIYLFISGASIWAGTVSSITASNVVVAFVLKSESIYASVGELAARAREAANQKTSLRELHCIKDKVALCVVVFVCMLTCLCDAASLHFICMQEYLHRRPLLPPSDSQGSPLHNPFLTWSCHMRPETSPCLLVVLFQAKTVLLYKSQKPVQTAVCVFECV